MRTTSPVGPSPRTVISSPHRASQSGQVRKTVLVSSAMVTSLPLLVGPDRADPHAMLPPVRQLHPVPTDDVDPAEVYGSAPRVPHADGRPWLLLNMVTSVDG